MKRITKTIDMYDIAALTANPWAEESVFPRKPVDLTPPPKFAESRDRLPAPHWEGHADTIACYWKAWELAFGNLRIPEAKIGFVSPYIDTAFNGCIFMWDSVFMLHFGRYGSAVFNFQQTLDNFYARQHRDGFICREISWSDGAERFERNDVSSTGPNLMPWSEWEYYLNTGDKERLAAVFPPLLAYTTWFRKWRSWPDGAYFSSGWGCGMDNQPRQPPGCKPAWEHGFMSWIDTTCQQILANRYLIEMARVLGREQDVAALVEETGRLAAHVNAKMWSGKKKFYFDRFRDGTLSDVKTIGAYWALIVDIVPPERRMFFSCTDGTMVLELYASTLRYRRIGDKEETLLDFKTDGHGGGDHVLPRLPRSSQRRADRSLAGPGADPYGGDGGREPLCPQRGRAASGSLPAAGWNRKWHRARDLPRWCLLPA